MGFLEQQARLHLQGKVVQRQPMTGQCGGD